MASVILRTMKAAGIKATLSVILLNILFVLPSCKKDEILHENLVIDNNTPPENNGISTLQLHNYINNIYIDLFGRAPTDSELQDKSDFMRSNDFNEEARGIIIDELMAEYEYYKNINILTSQKMLVDVDSITITYQIDLFEYFIYLNELSGDTLFNAFYEYEIFKLEKLLNAPIDLYEGTIGIDEYMKRFIFNNFYDEVNMGSLNFVIACFENLFHRAPTDEELSDGINMVDGVSSQLFLIDGNTKEEFIDIVTTHAEFYQGQVLEAYSTLLARSPNSWEMNEYTQMIGEDNNFNRVKKIIMQSEEYAGF